MVDLLEKAWEMSLIVLVGAMWRAFPTGSSTSSWKVRQVVVAFPLVVLVVGVVVVKWISLDLHNCCAAL
jgi:hypothetical protein